MCIDTCYWFDKSTKRKNGLESYYTFCDQEYRIIIKHVTTCWLSLERAVNRILKQYATLKSYFNYENEQQAQFERLVSLFQDPMTEVYLLFIQNVLPCFTHKPIPTERRTLASCASTPVTLPSKESFSQS